MPTDPESNDPRAELRQQYFAAWRKAQAREILTPLEAQIADVCREHPEYHALLNHPEQSQELEFLPELGASNPFLHMGLHLAIREQVNTDRPAGIRTLFHRWQQQLHDPLEVEHQMLEVLAETLWQAQRSGLAPDETRYLQALELRFQQH